MERLMLLGPQELQSGIYTGVNKVAVAFWADAENVVFKELGVQRIRGGRGLSTIVTGVRALAQASVPPQDRIYAGTDTRVMMYALETGTWSPTTLHTWATAGQYADLETWGNWLIATNGVDPVQIWKNTGVMAALAGTTFTSAKVLKRKLVYLFAINTNNGKTMIEWSDESDPETWTPTADNMAGNMTIRDIDSELLAAVDLGSALAVYSENALVVGTYVGAPNVWGFRTAVRGVGAVSRRSVVSVDPMNYGLNKTGVFMTDGSSYVYLDDPDMRKWLRLVDWSKANLIWGFHDITLNCVTWYFQDVAAKWHSISYHYMQKFFTKGNLQQTAGIHQEVFDFPIVVDNLNYLTSWQDADTYLGGPVEFFIQSKPLDFGTAGLYKSVQLVKVDGVWGADVNLRVRAHVHPEDPGVVVHDKVLQRQNYMDYEAQHFSFELHGSSVMTVNQLEFFGVPGGLAL